MRLRGLLHKGRSRRRTLTFATVFVVAGSTLTVIPAASAAIPGHGFGYVWASEASSAVGVAYTPITPWSFNSTGGTNTVTRLGTGRYQVSFAGYGPFGTAQVTAYGTLRADDYCKIHHWIGFNGQAATDLFVNCFDRTGTPVDAQFTATYTDPEPGMARSAYLWSERPSPPIGSAYFPAADFQYNPTGNQNWVSRNSTGRYLVGLTGLGPTQGPGDFLVTAYGSTVSYCTVLTTNEDSFSVFLNVDCFTPGGDFVDSQFVVNYIESGNTLFSTGPRTMAYADVICMDFGILRGQCPFVRARPSSGVRVQRIDKGEWSVFLPVGLGAGNVQVTTRNDERTPRRRCKVAFWDDVSGIRINCRDALGQRVHGAHFTVSFVV